MNGNYLLINFLIIEECYLQMVDNRFLIFQLNWSNILDNLTFGSITIFIVVLLKIKRHVCGRKKFSINKRPKNKFRLMFY